MNTTSMEAIRRQFDAACQVPTSSPAQESASSLERRASQAGELLGHDVSIDQMKRWDAEIRTWYSLLPSFRQEQLAEPEIQSWYLCQLAPPWRSLLSEVVDSGPFNPRMPAVEAPDEPLDLETGDPLEAILAVTDATQRRQYGAFFTPAVMADYILNEVDQRLRSFGLTAGLADSRRWGEWHSTRELGHASPFRSADDPVVSVHDPATGSGVFLLRTLRHVHRTWQSQTHVSSQSTADRQPWSEYVARDLLPRISGTELLPSAYVACVLNIAMLLLDLGTDFRGLGTLNVQPRNALLSPSHDGEVARSPRLAKGTAAGQILRDARGLAWKPSTVIVGNPPFSGVSTHQGTWIRKLMRGKETSSQHAGDSRQGNAAKLTARWANYYEVDGRPLGERKVWIDDDYVKFLRLAHWHVEQQGFGVVAFVTNHGYIDNASFRGVRFQLLESFRDIQIVNLHGNAKRAQRRPDLNTSSETRDENCFPIEQGVAIGIFSKPPSAETVASQSMVQYTDLKGTRDEKLAALEQAAAADHPSSRRSPLQGKRHEPPPPRYPFRPRNRRMVPEWRDSLAITSWMPLNSTVPVTARDSFVTDTCRERLIQRLREFADLSVPDDEIRKKFFGRSRSRKYPPGDTRGWKLADARRRLASLTDFEPYLLECAYRPFEHRHVFWTSWMIDWGRQAVSRHFTAGPNVALITRRQMLPDHPCNFFWVVDRIPLDGLIRSDNRGSELFCPLWEYPANGELSFERTPNFNTVLAYRLAASIGREWVGRDTESAPGIVTPHDLFHFIYGQFNVPAYRSRFAEQLVEEFPRVLWPRSVQEFDRLAAAGERLVRSHLVPELLQGESPQPEWIGAATKLAAGYPRFIEGDSGAVHVSSHTRVVNVPQPVWEYRVGAHQVCRRWLQNRPNKQISSRDRNQFLLIVKAIRETLTVTGSLSDDLALG